MKVAVIYRGMYLRDRPNSKSTNFFKVVENNKQLFLNLLPPHDLYLDTKSFDKKNDEQLQKSLNIKKIRFVSGNECSIDSIIKSFEIADFSSYDFVYSIRFGVKFNKPFSMFKIDETKFNCLWREPKRFNNRDNTRVSDHIFAFNPKYISKIKEADYQDKNICYNSGELIGAIDKAHHICNYLKFDIEQDVNFMVEGEHWSGGYEYDVVGKSYIELQRGF
tara:strand:- start:699 stop:1358 length:660 start_codon:yes stop_codon:yes gene_type:complete